MNELLLWSLVFVGSLAVLLKSSDFFIDAAERIGLGLGLSPFVVGVTLVAAGTSLPELITSIVSVSSGASEIVIGNVIGSNITNICLVLGVVGFLAKKIEIKFNIMRVDAPVLFGSAILLFLMIMDNNYTTIEAVVMMLGMAFYLFYTAMGSEPPEGEETSNEKLRPLDFLIIAGSAVGIYFGAEYNVRSIIELSEILNVGKEAIALTFVALGTSLPELVVSIVAMRKGRLEMAVGNVLGSNIFNTFAVMGIPALFGKLIIPASIMAFSMPLMIGLTLLFLFIVSDREVNRWEGLLLLLFYAYFFLSTFQ